MAILLFIGAGKPQDVSLLVLHTVQKWDRVGVFDLRRSKLWPF